MKIKKIILIFVILQNKVMKKNEIEKSMFEELLDVLSIQQSVQASIFFCALLTP